MSEKEYDDREVRLGTELANCHGTRIRTKAHALSLPKTWSNKMITLNEVGAHCLGWKPPHVGNVFWQIEEGLMADKPPDIAIGEPITDAQYGNIMRLREKAIKYDHDAYVLNLWKAVCIHSGLTGATVQRWLACATPGQTRDAAIDTLIADTPKNVQAAWEKMNK